MTSLVGPLISSSASDLGIPFRASIIAGAGAIEFDATTREQHTGETRLTEHPVEEGSAVSDHALDQPDTLTLDVIISNNPIVLLASLNAQPIKAGGDPKTRAEEAYEEFDRLKRTAATLIVTTKLRTYEDMILVGLSTTRDASSDEILQITLSFREFRKATVEFERVRAPDDTVSSEPSNLGRKQTTEADPEVDEQAQSLLGSLAGFAS